MPHPGIRKLLRAAATWLVVAWTTFGLALLALEYLPVGLGVLIGATAADGTESRPARVKFKWTPNPSLPGV